MARGKVPVPDNILFDTNKGGNNVNNKEKHVYRRERFHSKGKQI